MSNLIDLTEEDDTQDSRSLSLPQRLSSSIPSHQLQGNGRMLYQNPSQSSYLGTYTDQGAYTQPPRFTEEQRSTGNDYMDPRIQNLPPRNIDELRAALMNARDSRNANGYSNMPSATFRAIPTFSELSKPQAQSVSVQIPIFSEPSNSCSSYLQPNQTATEWNKYLLSRTNNSSSNDISSQSNGKFNPPMTTPYNVYNSIYNNQPMLAYKDFSGMTAQSYQPQDQFYGMNSGSYAVVSFSLLNTTEFVIKADNAMLPKSIIQTIRKFPAKLDKSEKHVILPLDSHDRLLTAIGNHHKNIKVEPLPRNTIATAMLRNQNEKQTLSTSSGTLKEKLPSSLFSSLAEFQKEGVEFVVKNGGRALIADEMGLGKTRSAIASAAMYQEDWPVLVVCPSSARHHWQSEISTLLSPELIKPSDILLIESAYCNSLPVENVPPPILGSEPMGRQSNDSSSSNEKSNTSLKQFKFFIVSYSLVGKVLSRLSALDFNVIIADESHYLKNSRAKRTKCLLPLLIKSRRTILLSGTPALSRPIELFTQLHALDSKLWADEKEYGKRYCKMSRGQKPGFGQEFKGASNTRELHVILTSTIMIRRLKNDILQQLPKKHRKIVKVQVEDEAKREEFRASLEEIAKRQEILKQRKREIKTNRKNKTAVDSTTMDTDPTNVDISSMQEEKKQILMQLFTRSGEAKFPSIKPHIEEFLSNPLSGKLLIFAHHKPVMDMIQEHLTYLGIEFMRIDGRTSSKDRQSKSLNFQNSSTCRVGILSITAAGIALTLTAAATVFFVEIFWTPGSLIQAEDRAHRIGQNNQVSVTYFLADETIDELLWPLVRQKMKTLGEVVEGQDDIDLSTTKQTDDEKGNLFSPKRKRQKRTDPIQNTSGIADAETQIDDNSADSSSEDNRDDCEVENNSVQIDDLEDVAEEIAKVCSDSMKVSKADDEAEDEEEAEEDENEGESSKAKESSDNFEKLLNEDLEDADPIAILFKKTESFRDDPEQLAKFVYGESKSSMYQATSLFPPNNYSSAKSACSSKPLDPKAKLAQILLRHSKPNCLRQNDQKAMNDDYRQRIEHFKLEQQKQNQFLQQFNALQEQQQIHLKNRIDKQKMLEYQMTQQNLLNSIKGSKQQTTWRTKGGEIIELLDEEEPSKIQPCMLPPQLYNSNEVIEIDDDDNEFFGETSSYSGETTLPNDKSSSSSSLPQNNEFPPI